ncbi:Putative SOS response-associated peptidase YedK [Roseivivax jejudonensis]|uniref:Abasic site processing protein n=1 Tax=Roseivivax jejudonensis TaxID=1529041 RepID=A0A1X6ZM03_9RHOB|nr:SOS response-associated peptidase [Roseivivax jejudonensis]SLN53289.1 Putative SOS response-associated peptidase YedK [Roseivivax jejudonensis]
MCGRFAVTLPPDAMARLFDAVPGNDVPGAENMDVRPTTTIAAVRRDDGGTRRLDGMRWGFLPHWYKDPKDGPLLINARAETVAEKPAFRAAARERRCLIPSSGFYEWQRFEDGRKQPYLITRTDGEPLVMAGIWQDWERDGTAYRSCAIVTTEAEGRMADIHTRMPVIVDQADWPLWLGEDGKGAARLMRAAPEGSLDFTERAPG